MPLAKHTATSKGAKRGTAGGREAPREPRHNAARGPGPGTSTKRTAKARMREGGDTGRTEAAAPEPTAGGGSDVPSPAPSPRASLTTLRVADLVTLLRTMGSVHITAELVESDLEAGAPTNVDGSINFVHYAAWLERLGG